MHINRGRQRATEPDEWGWIEGKLNAADAITRGSKVKEIIGECDWLNGPEFLRDPVEEWPVRREVRRDIKLPEMKTASEVVAKVEGEIKESLEARIDVNRLCKAGQSKTTNDRASAWKGTLSI